MSQWARGGSLGEKKNLILISHKLISINHVDIFPKTFIVIHPMDLELTNLSSTQKRDVVLELELIGR